MRNDETQKKKNWNRWPFALRVNSRMAEIDSKSEEVKMCVTIDANWKVCISKSANKQGHRSIGIYIFLNSEQQSIFMQLQMCYRQLASRLLVHIKYANQLVRNRFSIVKQQREKSIAHIQRQIEAKIKPNSSVAKAFSSISWCMHTCIKLTSFLLILL